MKITQLTHPVLWNYGGILQCYALQRVLMSIGVNATNLNYLPNNYAQYNTKNKILACIKSLFLRWGIRWKCSSIPMLVRSRIGESFEKKYIKFIKNPDKTATAYVVGSDQVWRPTYTRPMASTEFYFLSFASTAQRRQSIAYAASFGTDKWEGTPEETEKCRRLIHDFKAVSVREESGVQICRDVFGIHAVQMPDPTLLLTRGAYESLIAQEQNRYINTPYFAAYILDETAATRKLLNVLVAQRGLYLQHLLPHVTEPRWWDRLPLPVTQWLSYIRDCQFLITDSFHGCAMAIMFNKPFVCIGNTERGLARFDTLFSTFQLQERIAPAEEIQKINRLIDIPIHWNQVNSILEGERKRGVSFLQENLI